MKTKSISYGRTYPLGNYSSERIDLQADLDENEDEQAALSILKEKVERFHKENNQHLYTNLDEVHVSSQWSTQPEMLLHEISISTTVTQLKQWELLSKSKPEIKEAYDLKMEELSK